MDRLILIVFCVALAPGCVLIDVIGSPEATCQLTGEFAACLESLPHLVLEQQPMDEFERKVRRQTLAIYNTDGAVLSFDDWKSKHWIQLAGYHVDLVEYRYNHYRSLWFARNGKQNAGVNK